MTGGSKILQKYQIDGTYGGAVVTKLLNE